MTYLALNYATNDILLSPNGGVERVNDGRFIVQQVRCKLRTWLKEWLLDPRIGWLTVTDFEKNFDTFDIEDRARKIIINTDGVLSIDELSTSYSKRELTINFKARTIYGVIELSVPWGTT